MPFDDPEDLRDETAMRQLDQRFPMGQMTHDPQEQSIGQRILAGSARQPRPLDPAGAAQFQRTPFADRPAPGPAYSNEVQGRFTPTGPSLLQSGPSPANLRLAQQSSTPTAPTTGRRIDGTHGHGRRGTTQQPQNQRPPINNIEEQLRNDEGFSQRPYRDSRGNWTDGYGHRLGANGGQTPPVSREQAEATLQRDIQNATQQLDQQFPWARNLDDARRGVLRNMMFNMGPGNARRRTGLASFRQTLEMIRNGDYNGAATQMQRSAWARQVGPRATRLAEQMRTGRWQ